MMNRKSYHKKLNAKGLAFIATALAIASVGGSCTAELYAADGPGSFPYQSTGGDYVLAQAVYTAQGIPPTPVYTPTAPVAPVPQPAGLPQLPTEQVNDLTASIALYPDPLLAVMLPAATYWDEVAPANQWLAAHPNADEVSIQQQPYQDSLKELMHYPTVLAMMATHPEWTQALGMAFAYQPSDVLNTIQQWRATAQTDGTLYTTPQMQVVAAGGTIQILPATPDLVFVPQYDPAVVFVRHDQRDANIIRFDAGRDRRWLDHDLDWRDRVVRVPVRNQRDVVAAPPRPEQPRLVTPALPERPRVDQPEPTERRVFTRTDIRPDQRFPDRIEMPQPDHKVLTPAPRLVQTPAHLPEKDQPARPDVGRGEVNGRDR